MGKKMNKDKRLVYHGEDGSIKILCPAPDIFEEGSRTRSMLESQDLFIADDKEAWDYIIAREKEVGNIKEDTVYSIVDVSEIPEDRTFRNAWDFCHKKKECSINMDKAKELHKDKLRELRKPKLEALDVQFMRAVEAGLSKDELKPISDAKQELRDVTDLDMPNTPEELKEFIPECLK